MMSQKSRADNISSWREQLTILNVADSLSEIRPNLWLISQAQRLSVTLLGTFRWSFGIESRHDEARKGEERMAILLWKVCLGESGDAESTSEKLWYGGFTLLEWRTPQYTLGCGLSRRDARRGCCSRGNTTGVGNPGRSRTEKKILTAGGALTGTTETRRMYCRGRQYTVDEGVVRVWPPVNPPSGWRNQTGC